MRVDERWPRALWVVRHGQSAGNAARDAAEAAGQARIDIAERDMDVPLSRLGEEQARAIGKWFATLPVDGRPTRVLTSPYVRARQTANLILASADMDVEPTFDERFREREFGVLDGLTHKGIVEMYPDESKRRTRLGKFYHRPPGGESWCDVFLRLRSAVESMKLEYANERVLCVAHQVTVLGLRYVLEHLTEQEILAIDAKGDIANCSVTSFTFTGTPNIELFNFIAPIEHAGAPTTKKDDVTQER